MSNGAGERRRAFFFDRDGIVNVRLWGDYVKTIDEFVFLDDFFPVFELVKQSGWLAILITNQQGVGKGIMSGEQLDVLHSHMQEQIEHQTGFRFDGIYACTDLRTTPGNCLKPSPAMVLKAMGDFGLDAADCVMVGDMPTDAEAGRLAGVATVLVGQYSVETYPEADVCCNDLRGLYEVLSRLF